MGNVIKGNRYRMVDNRSFDLPLPLKWELLKADDPIALYEVSDDEKVSFSILTKHKENMITPIDRPLDIADIYYFFSSRVFQNCTPYTYPELKLVGLEKYSVYDIIRKTRGITPFDTYWLRFDGDNCDYDTAFNSWNSLMSNCEAFETSENPVSSSVIVPSSVPATDKIISSEPVEKTPEKETESYDKSHVDDILNQHKVDVAEKISREKSNDSEGNSSGSISGNSMSIDEIDALLMQSGLEGGFDKPERKKEEPQSSGGNMSQDDIEKMLAAAGNTAPETPVEEPKSSGGNMSQDDIEKMLAAAGNTAPETPVEEPKSSGGNMSQDDIEKMLAAAGNTAPETPVEEPKSSGGNMSQDDIEKMLAAAGNTAPETPVEEPKSSGGNMSQDDIEKMLAAAGNTAPETPVEEPKSSGGNMSQDDIEKMLAAAWNTAPETPVEEPQSGGGKMSQEDIEALLNGMKEDATT